MAIDTTRTFEIKGSPRKLVGIALLGVLMTGLALALALGLFPGAGVHAIERAILWFGVVFFGACTLIAIARALKSSGVVVRLTPNGISDVRVAAGELPWRSVLGVSTWAFSGQKILVLAVAPEAEARLGLTRMARWSRRANTALGADGLCYASQGLAIGHDEFVAAVAAYLDARQKS
jgi:hypothetical protein